jgi:hypothetical protein
MCQLDRLELEFEIVTLIHNIHEYKKLGFPTVVMQNRLEYCSAKFEALDHFVLNENETHLGASVRN